MGLLLRREYKRFPYYTFSSCVRLRIDHDSKLYTMITTGVGFRFPGVLGLEARGGELVTTLGMIFSTKRLALVQYGSFTMVPRLHVYFVKNMEESKFMV